MSTGVIAGLHDCRVDTGEGNQLLGVGEAIDVADFTQDNRAGSRPDAGYGEDDGIDFLQLLPDLHVDLIDLAFGVVDLLDQDADLKSEGVGSQIKAAGRLVGCRLEFLSLDSTMTAFTGFSEQGGQRFGVLPKRNDLPL